ncbi:hypothetical protein BO221_24440 [Archangium sp. Cb G35]|uniref:hypothetical protein n=1 Tax=Archangium sp. Cb G35 TaxID=1920190 RepID=UPI000936508C|nr:hypothetical protein [Archangium sp. Cb G35]OJT21907.1 hypothetical protein BO221_24440 [Archangium sp. Cb G35]
MMSMPGRWCRSEAAVSWVALPLPAMLLGAWVARAHGVSVKAFGTNLVAAVFGMGLAVWLARRSWSHLVRLAPGIAAAVLVLLAATFLFPPVEGVHRWLSLGPVRLNASVVASPWAMLALWGLLQGGRPGLAVGLVTGTQLLHGAQPDAGQALALLAGVLVLFIGARSLSWGWKVAGGGLAAMGVALACMRFDSLEAVPHVERIIHLAAARGVPCLLAALVALGLLLLPMVHGAVGLRTARSDSALLAGALGAYWLGTLAVTEWGNYPVPVMGAGAGPVLGWYCTLGILLCRGAQATLGKSTSVPATTLR